MDDNRISEIRAALDTYYDAGTSSSEAVVLARITRIVDREPVREGPRDNWCRAEHCPHRNWRSGSVPTHQIGPGCPEPSPAPREESPPAPRVFFPGDTVPADVPLMSLPDTIEGPMVALSEPDNVDRRLPKGWGPALEIRIPSSEEFQAAVDQASAEREANP